MTMDDLLEAINEHYHSEGEYPTVKVSWEFYLNNTMPFYGLAIDGMSIEIDDNLNQDWELV